MATYENMSAPQQEYPCMMYSADGRQVIVQSQEEYDQLQGEWVHTPGEVGIIVNPSFEDIRDGEPFPTSWAPGAYKKKA